MVFMRRSFITVITLAAGMACSIIPAILPGGPPQDAVETSVAGTLAAQPLNPADEAPKQPEAPTAELQGDEQPTQLPLPPNVLQIAYTDPSNNLWLWKDGADPALLAGSGDVSSVILSGDGSMAAYTRSNKGADASLWVINLDGTNTRQVVSKDDLAALGRDPAAFFDNPGMVNDIRGVNFYGLQWIPKSHTLAYTCQPFFDGPGLMINDDLQLVDADTGERSTLLSPGQGGLASYSPDGNKMAVVTAERISLLNSDGSSRIEALSYPPVMTYSEYQYYPQPQWAPDSGSLLVAIPPEDPMAQPPLATTIYRIGVDGAPAAPVSMVISAFLNNIRFSPDQSKMGYVSDTGLPQENQKALHIADINGSNDFIYHQGEWVAIDKWSPDSSRFIFNIGGDYIKVLGQGGTGYLPLAEGNLRILDTSWIDEQKILLLVDNGNNLEMRIYSLDGNSRVVLNLPGGYEFSQPSFSIYP